MFLSEPNHSDLSLSFLLSLLLMRAIINPNAAIATKTPVNMNAGEVSRNSSRKYPVKIGMARDAAISAPKLRYSEYFFGRKFLGNESGRTLYFGIPCVIDITFI